MTDYNTTFTIRRLWLIFVISMIAMFSILLYFGGQIYQKAPPIPEVVQSTAGESLFGDSDISRGQNIWQSLGGMQKGSIWGHGSYLAPDWSADWLHREAVALLELSAQETYDTGYGMLDIAQQEALKAWLRLEMRENTYNPGTGAITVSQNRARAIRQVSAHYADIFQNTGSENSLRLREQYAFSPTTTLADGDMHALTAFVFWTAWSATTTRPGASITYTSNWPYEPLVGNTPSVELFVWTFVSIFLLLAGIGALVWFYAKQYDLWRDHMMPEGGTSSTNLLAAATITPSMRATGKYFWTVVALIAVQIFLGTVTAHYAVEGQDFYGIPLAEYLPYSVTRTWHTQLAVFWIATAWLATGLYVGPLISGHEPRFQRFGVNFLQFSIYLPVDYRSRVADRGVAWHQPVF